MTTPFQVRRAANIVSKGGVILYPTDTIYGLGCNPFDHQAVRRIFRIKRRSGSKTLILAAGTMEQLKRCIDVPADTDLSAETPTTWIVPANDDCPAWLVAEDGTIAVRLADHPVIRGICEATSLPLVSTSANISGRRPVNDPVSIHRTFHDTVDAILVGDEHSTGSASTIRFLNSDKVIRP